MGMAALNRAPQRRSLAQTRAPGHTSSSKLRGRIRTARGVGGRHRSGASARPHCEQSLTAIESCISPWTRPAQTTRRSPSAACAATSASAPRSPGSSSSSPPGETLVVLGPNGAGKTTLLRILADPAAPERRRGRRARLRAAGRGLEAARPGRLPRPRAAAVPRPERRARTCASTRGCTGSSRRAPRRGSRSCWPRSGWSGAPTTGRRALGRDAPAAGDLPLRPARAGAAAARRARLPPRRRGPRAGRAR